MATIKVKCPYCDITNKQAKEDDSIMETIIILLILVIVNETIKNIKE